MRELVEKDQHVIMIPADFKNANKGIITEVSPEGFTLQLDYEPVGVLMPATAVATSSLVDAVTLLLKVDSIFKLSMEFLTSVIMEIILL